MEKYELAVLYHPDLEIDLEKAAQKVNKIIADNKGKVIAEDNWGKRKLAYNIKGLGSALYVFYTVEMPSQSVQKLESALNITDEVIRFLITKIDQKAIDKAEAFKAAKEASKAKSQKFTKDSKAVKAEEDQESNEE